MPKYIIYARKSSDREDRQMASIDDQIREMRKIADKDDLEIIDEIIETKSAKEAGRPGFRELVRRLYANEAQGVLCWKPNRLARNMTDGGLIIDLLSQGVIKHLRTCHRSYYPEDNVVMLAVEFGVANQFVKDLSLDAKRGLRSKAERGWYPTINLPIGYRHRRYARMGEPEIASDPDSFPKMKELWDMFLTGGYSIADLYFHARNTLELKTVKGKLIGRTSFYRIFRHPFYAGTFIWGGKTYQGKHEPMVTQEQFRRVQQLLARDARSVGSSRTIMPYQKLMRCGECTSMISLEHKIQVRCPNCKRKFSAKHKTSCSKCGLAIKDMNAPKILDITYARCGRNHQTCKQPYVQLPDLEKQLLAKLDSIQVSTSFTQAGKVVLKWLRTESPPSEVSWYDQACTYLDYAATSKDSLLQGDPKTKTQIARGLGPNHTILDKRHQCEVLGIYPIIREIFAETRTDKAFLTLEQSPDSRRALKDYVVGSSYVRAQWHNIRTWIIRNFPCD